MIRFEVTGATPEEFAQNAMSAWGLLAIGLQQAMCARTPEQASPSGSPPKSIEMPATSGSESSSTASKADEVSEAYFGEEKIKERAKLASDKLDDLFASEELGRPVGASAAPSEKPTKIAKNSSKGPKLDDLKTRLSEVIVAATERWDQKRANAYARALLARFGVAKLGELSPDKFESFMLTAQRFVEGIEPEC